MHNSQLELSSKRVELNVYESFKYFTKELLRKYLKTIFVISILRFHHEVGLNESRYFDLFSQLAMKPQHTKLALTEAPFLLFQTFGAISAIFIF